MTDFTHTYSQPRPTLSGGIGVGTGASARTGDSAGDGARRIIIAAGILRIGTDTIGVDMIPSGITDGAEARITLGVALVTMDGVADSAQDIPTIARRATHSRPTIAVAR